MRNSIFTKTLSVFFLISLIAPSLSLAQRRTSVVASNKAPKCTGGWTGVVTYKRTQSKTDSKRVERVSMRGHDTRTWEMKYEYNARVVVVESSERNGSSEGRASVIHNFSSNETVDAVELNSCDRGKTWKRDEGDVKVRNENFRLG